MTCPHLHTSTKRVKRSFLELTFSHETLVCDDCGAYLRGEEYEKAYGKWLEEMYKAKRSKFQIQCHFSDHFITCAESYLEDHPGVSMTEFLRILATSYLNIIDIDEVRSARFDAILDRDVLESLQESPERTRFSIQFKPAMMADIVAISEVLGMRMSHVVEESVLKTMTAIVSQDPQMADFWEREVRGVVEMLLKSA